MDTVNQLVSTIKQIMVAPGGMAEDQETRVAAEYARLCRDAQKRLQDCHDLLNRGLRNEAIYAAEQAPALLQLIGELEFAGAEQWRQIAADKQLASPLPFNMEQVKQLDEQYHQQTVLEPLQSLYRKLSIKQAPTNERLALLRKLRAADKANPNWGRDIETLEIARFKEIDTALRTASGKITEDIAAGLVRELEETQLQVKPAPALVERAQSLHLELRTRRYNGQMTELAGRMNDAFTAMDLSALSELVARWDALAEQEQLPPPRKASEIVADALDWCREKLEQRRKVEEFEQQCGQLRKLIDAGTASSAELSRLRSRLEAYSLDMPEDLAAQVQNAVFVAAAQEQRQARLRIVGIAAAVILFVGLVSVSVWLLLDRRERNELVAQIDNYTRRLELDTGTRYLSQLAEQKPARMKQPAIVRAVADFEKAKSTEMQRRQDLDTALKQAEAEPFDSPTVDPLLQKAKQLARMDAEQEAVVNLRATIAAKKQEKQRKIDQQVIMLLDSVSTKYAEVRSTQESAPLRALAKDLDVLLAQAESIQGVSGELASKAKDYRTRYAAEIARADDMDRRARERQQAQVALDGALQQARGKLPDIKAYIAAMEDIEQKWPDDPGVGSLAAWKSVVPASIAVIQVNDGIRMCLRQNASSPFGGDRAAVVRDLSKHVLDQNIEVDNPYSPLIAKLKVRAKGIADFSEQSKELRDKLDHKLISQVQEVVIRGREGDVRYYIPDDVRVQPNSSGALGFQYYDDQHRTKNTLLQGGSVVSTPTVAAHCQLAKALSALASQEQKSPDWSSIVPQMLLDTAAFKNANPRVQAMLLQHLVTLNDAVGNPADLSPELRRQIEEVSPRHINFLAPSNNVEIKDELAAIQKRCERLAPALAEHLGGARQKQAVLLRAEIEALYRPLAVSATVSRTVAGQAAITPLGGNPREYWAIVMNDSHPVFRIVGVAKAGEAPAWLAGESLPVGQVLFSPQDDGETAKLLARATSGVSGVSPTIWPINVKPDGGRK